MIKIFLYGISANENLGGPSLMHGAHEVIKELHASYELVVYQNLPVDRTAVSDMNFPVYEIPYTHPKAILWDALKCRMGIRLRNPRRAAFFNHLRRSDIVANLYGIAFCSNFGQGDTGFLGGIKDALQQFPINAAARLFGIKSVKCPSSYGPIRSKCHRGAARFSANVLFHQMLAREVESRRQMMEVAGVAKEIVVSPDLGNLMPYRAEKSALPGPIGISVSHQIIKQWKSKDSYIDCIVNLIHDIHQQLGKSIVLIPNEIVSSKVYHDTHVAQQIMGCLGAGGEDVQILNVKEMSGCEIKTAISQCELIISSRYHSCVASLSSGVPTLVLGWHYKYDELMKLYHQDEWILSSSDCTSERVIGRFRDLWNTRERAALEIRSCYAGVREQILKTGSMIFTR